MACFPSVLPSQAGRTSTQSQASVTATPTAQCHAQRAKAAVLPAVVVFLLFVHDHGGGLRLRRRVVGRRLLRGWIVAALRRHLETRLRRRIVGVLLGVAHRQAGLGGSLAGDFDATNAKVIRFSVCDHLGATPQQYRNGKVLWRWGLARRHAGWRAAIGQPHGGRRGKGEADSRVTAFSLLV